MGTGGVGRGVGKEGGGEVRREIETMAAGVSCCVCSFNGRSLVNRTLLLEPLAHRQEKSVIRFSQDARAEGKVSTSLHLPLTQMFHSQIIANGGNVHSTGRHKQATAFPLQSDENNTHSSCTLQSSPHFSYRGCRLRYRASQLPLVIQLSTPFCPEICALNFSALHVCTVLAVRICFRRAEN